MPLNKLIEPLDAARDVASVRRVFGEPQQVGDTTLIPVASVTYAFGYGYGGGPERTDEQGNPVTSAGGGGGGGQSRARPVAVIEVTADSTRVTPVEDKTRVALAAFAMIAWNVFWVMKTIRAWMKTRRK